MACDSTYPLISGSDMRVVLEDTAIASCDLLDVKHLHPSMLRWQGQPDGFETAWPMEVTEMYATSE